MNIPLYLNFIIGTIASGTVYIHSTERFYFNLSTSILKKWCSLFNHSGPITTVSISPSLALDRVGNEPYTFKSFEKFWSVILSI
jgi:hypothetical protein